VTKSVGIFCSAGLLRIDFAVVTGAKKVRRLQNLGLQNFLTGSMQRVKNTD